MNKKIMRILLIVLVTTVFLQVFYSRKLSSQNNIVVYNTKSVYNKTLREMNLELNCLSEKNIISASEVNGKWHIELKLEGEKQEILEELTKLKKYNISNFVINKDENEKSIIIEISSNESA